MKALILIAISLISIAAHAGFTPSDEWPVTQASSVISDKLLALNAPDPIYAKGVCCADRCINGTCPNAYWADSVQSCRAMGHFPVTYTSCGKRPYGW